ncbi:MAG: TrbI F-type domain-containing protein [Legionella sp.]|uniref:TrbI F-type domain-containing protein n=1 Tax=Legionella sp. TaxID=459 RepID=UPI0039E60743
MRISWHHGLGVGIFVLGLGLGSLWSPRTEIVLFDSHRVHAQLIRQLALHQASDVQIAKTSQKLKKMLPQIINEYALNHHVLIIEKQHVLSGGVDVTSQLINELSQAMRGSK